MEALGFTETGTLDPRVYAELCGLSGMLPRLDQVFKPIGGSGGGGSGGAETNNKGTGAGPAGQQQDLEEESELFFFDASGANLTDEELLALSVLLRKRPLKAINLSDNALLSNSAFVSFFQRVTTSDACKRSISSIKISNCPKLSDPALECLTQNFLNMQNLKEVSLRGFKNLSPQSLLKCADVLGQKLMRRVDVAHLDLPRGTAANFLEKILENRSLEYLDCSWNVLDEASFDLLRGKLSWHPKLAVGGGSEGKIWQYLRRRVAYNHGSDCAFT